MGNKKPLSDQKQRDIIINDLDSNIMVEAGAGSGKTTSLVDRMIRLLATGTADLASMVAVTFTNKAAADLKERFQEKLENILRETPWDDDDYTLLKNALDNLEQTNISTIHTFCADILRERPTEAGVDPDFNILEGVEEGALIEEYWHYYLDSDSDIRNLQREHGLPLDALFEAYKAILRHPDIEFIIPAAKKPDIKSKIPDITRLLDELGAMFPETAPENDWDKFQLAFIDAKAILANADDNVSAYKALDVLDRASVTQSRWPQDHRKTVKKRTDEFKRDVSSAACSAWRDYLYTLIMPHLIKAARGYPDWLLSRGYLDFNGLLLQTANLLRLQPQVRSYFSERYSHILVDEFQDTDPIQAEILLLLTSTNSEETNWQKCTPKPGSLFIVGDPKQSIYRFRRADIDLYNKTRDIITSSGGLALNLTANFRSFDSIVDFVNETFSDVFEDEPTPFQARNAPLDATKTADQGISSGVFVINTPPGNKEDVYGADAQLVAAWIDNALSTGLLIQDNDAKNARSCKPSDFMIITPMKTELDAYAKAFTDRGIPIRVKGARPTQSNHLLLEFIKLLGVIAEPENDIGILSVLRGIFFGISDQQLYNHKIIAGGCWDIMVTDKGDPGVLEALAVLNKYYQWSRTRPIDRALVEIVADAGIIPYATSTGLFEGDGAAFMHTVELISHYAIKEHLNFPQAIRFINNLIAGGEDIELACLDTGMPDSVLLLNVHQAKGLQAPIVFLAAPYTKKKKDIYLHISRKGDSPCGYFSINANKRIYVHPTGWDELQGFEECYRNAEAERLVYVAATRAKQMLIVSKTDKKSHWSLLDDYLSDAEILVIPDAQPIAAMDTKQLAKESTALVADYKLYEPSVKAVKDFLTTKTYEDTRVTDPDERHGHTGYRAGMGKKWGSMVHDILSLALELGQNSIDDIVPAKLEQYGFDKSDIEILGKTLDTVFNSMIWKRAQGAKERLSETSFITAFADPIPGIVSGTIDLALMEDGGWVIIDYKTDIIRGDLDELTDIYRPQIEQYSKYWAHCTGQPVKESYLFFVSSGEIVAV